MAERIDPKWAWAPYEPSRQNRWDLKKAGHLFRRAAFGASTAELRQAVKDGPHKTIDRLLAGPGESGDYAVAMAAFRRPRRNNIGVARGAWVVSMLDGPHPLREKLTLFWHNHFATSVAKVATAGYMVGQYELMHRHALGPFGPMLQEISKDPAMMVWLDTVLSTKGQPNENYARELMELFSLGIGNYTENDIREAAKAFTGWEIRNGKFNFNKAQNDPGDKTFFGRKGKWQGEDIVRMCLEHPACPRFIARKMFRAYVSEMIEPDAELIEPLARTYREHGLDSKHLLETILRSNLFFAAAAYRSKIKSPVEFALGIVRGLEIRVNASAIAGALETLGQNLFAPPSVKGWDGGQAWLNGQTLLFRQNLALALCSRGSLVQDPEKDEKPREERILEPADLLRKYHRKTPGEQVDFLLDLFLQGDVAADTRQRLRDYAAEALKQELPVYWQEDERERHPARALCHLILTLPEFQLC